MAKTQPVARRNRGIIKRLFKTHLNFIKSRMFSSVVSASEGNLYSIELAYLRVLTNLFESRLLKRSLKVLSN